MVILGIDPGIANTGYGVVARRGGRLGALDGGVITTRPATAQAQRLVAIHARIDELLCEYAPDAVAFEELYFGVNAGSAFAVGQALGVVLLAAGRHGVPCEAYTPQQVKSAVTGSGRAAKEQVATMVRTLLALDATPQPDHATDALAIAICHANAAPYAAALATATARPAALAQAAP